MGRFHLPPADERSPSSLNLVCRAFRSPVFDEDDVRQECEVARLTRGQYREQFVRCNLARAVNHTRDGKRVGEAGRHPNRMRVTRTVAGEAVSDTPNPLAAMLSRESVNLLRRAIQSLPLDERQVLRARFYKNLTLQAIGTIRNQTKQRIHQIEAAGLKRLRRKLECVDDEAGAKLSAALHPAGCISDGERVARSPECHAGARPADAARSVHAPTAARQRAGAWSVDRRGEGAEAAQSPA